MFSKPTTLSRITQDNALRKILSRRLDCSRMATWQTHNCCNSTNINVNNPLICNSNGIISTQTNTLFGEVNHVHQLSEDIGNLFNQEEYSDISLIVENVSFYAHRVILASRSQYFRALLYGGLRESQISNRTIEIKECKAAAFQTLLLYIYTGKVNLIKEKEDTLLDLLGLVHQYGFEQLEISVSNYLKSILSLKNVCMIYDTACLYNLNTLRLKCAQFIDCNAREIIKSEQFLTLSAEAFSSIISRDSFYCPEIDIFHAVKSWHRNHSLTKPLTDLTSKVRLTLMSMHELLKSVRYSNLFDLNILMDAIDIVNDESVITTTTTTTTTTDTANINGSTTQGQVKNNVVTNVVSTKTTREKNYRGMLRPEENIATKAFHAQVVEGEMKHALLDGEITNYDLDRGFTRHLIDDHHEIVVKLGEPSIFNHIKLLLWDRDARSYSYYIEVSTDDVTWTRIIDYRSYLCRSWQKLYFPAVVATSIRIVGTHNTVNKVFHLVSMEVYYTYKPFALIGHLLVPKDNVATIEASAVVPEGVSRQRNALINGDYEHYDWDSGYTCHQLGSGGIVVQLSQPYVVSSMRILLWDVDNRSYGYYIETSTDNTNWSMIVDKRNEDCKSWEILTFSPRAVVFIRIIGTHNTANEVFHCVHFECPCKPDVLKAYMKDRSILSSNEKILRSLALKNIDNTSSNENTKDEHPVHRTTYDEFYTYYSLLIEDVNEREENNLTPHSTLPFTIKIPSSELYSLSSSIEQESQITDEFPPTPSVSYAAAATSL